ncbi:hypothetical protein EG68_09880 [Paragonimus skrjabini miyazakii]|uniref:Uncharacterized protein n=1 Tax=Paragonimus skrjabini miyazakii TaxID=59628 RepID=A0A8S9YSM0_9TREM|nr:hypothetical protein EG68_09880 [Paragonimus skrjabini miyazakii]
MVKLHTNAMTATHVLTLSLLFGLCVIDGVVLPTVNVTRRLKPWEDNSSDLLFMRKLYEENLLPSYVFARTIKAK